MMQRENVFPSELSKEYFERRVRRHPVWKSEAEYKAFVLDMATGGKLIQKFEMAMSATAKYLVKSTDSWVIDEALICKLEKEKETLEDTNLESDTKRVQIEKKELIFSICVISEKNLRKVKMKKLITKRYVKGYLWM